MNTIKERFDATKGQYGIAQFRYGRHDGAHLVQEIVNGDGILFLAIAKGAIGVLRALNVRCGPIKLDPGEELTLAAVWPPVDKTEKNAIFQTWIITGA